MTAPKYKNEFGQQITTQIESSDKRPWGVWGWEEKLTLAAPVKDVKVFCKSGRDSWLVKRIAGDFAVGKTYEAKCTIAKDGTVDAIYTVK